VIQRTPFSVDVQPEYHGVAAVTVRGEIDLDNASAFEDALGGAVQGGSAQALVVDLTEVNFIDSTGVSALIRILERQRFARRSVAIAADDTPITTIFEIAHLERIMRMYPSRDAAVAAMSDGSRLS
jgi:anti-anti-sigma factor